MLSRVVGSILMHQSPLAPGCSGTGQWGREDRPLSTQPREGAVRDFLAVPQIPLPAGHRMVPVSPCWMLPAETQPCRSTEFPLPTPARGGWMLLAWPDSALRVAIWEGAAPHEPLGPTIFPSAISLSAAITPLLLLPCASQFHGCRGLCWLFPSRFIKNRICFAAEAIQGTAEAVRSEIWHPGGAGPICGSCQRGCSPELSSGPGLRAQSGEEQEKTPREIIYMTLISAQFLP